MDRLDSKSLVRKVLAGKNAWPQHLEKASLEGAHLSSSIRQPRPADVEIQGNKGPFFRDVSVVVDIQQKMSLKK